MRAQSRGGCKASPANKKGGCEVDGASEPTCKAYPAIVLFTKNSLNYKGILDFRNHNYLCNPSLPLRPQLCATPSSLWEYLCTPLCFAPPTLQPPFSLRGYVCTPRLLCALNSAPPLCFVRSTLYPPSTLRRLLCGGTQNPETKESKCVFGCQNRLRCRRERAV